jgi:hypothetical protein
MSSSDDLKFYVEINPPKMYILFLRRLAEKQLLGLKIFLLLTSIDYQIFLSMSKHHTSFKRIEVFLPFGSAPCPSPAMMIRYF